MLLNRMLNGEKSRKRVIFIPAMLSKHEKRFSPSVIKDASRTRDYKEALFWLKDAMIVNPCYNATDWTCQEHIAN
ncbi:MAG: hypothetical protein IJJ33_14365, partial [Victivallales bacterium]|nr:hypothetical protein [Victivallales bacterium]